MSDGVTLREALELSALAGVRLVAGASGLDRRVRYVNVMEVPDILDWVKSDELLLTTAYPLRDDRSRLDELVPRLVERGLAGLAIKPARYIDELPAVMLEDADRLAFPLLELPAETALADIINAVLGLILNKQAMRLERSAAIHERFTRIVLGGGGLREIADALSDLVNHPAAVVDGSGRFLAHSHRFPDVDGDRQVVADTPDSPEPRWNRLLIGDVYHDAAFQAVQAGPDQHVAVVVLAGPDQLGEEDLMALDRAAIVTALRLVQERMASATDRHFQAVCLDELVTGHLTDRAVLRERSLAFGWNMSLQRAVLVAELEEMHGRSFVELAGTPDETWAVQRLGDVARSVLGREAIVWERSAGIAALVVGNPADLDGLLTSAAHLRELAQSRLASVELSIGLGRIYGDPLELKESYNEAVRALGAVRGTGGKGQIASFAQLGLERLLLSCSEMELRAFVETTLGPLLRYEKEHPAANLLNTLRAYLEHNRTISGTAQAMYVHYNTVRYRLERLQGILGPFVDGPDQCLRLELALRVQSLLATVR